MKTIEKSQINFRVERIESYGRYGMSRSIKTLIYIDSMQLSTYLHSLDLLKTEAFLRNLEKKIKGLDEETKKNIVLKSVNVFINK